MPARHRAGQCGGQAQRRRLRRGGRACASGAGRHRGGARLFAAGVEAQVHFARRAGGVIPPPGGDQQTGGTVGAVV